MAERRRSNEFNNLYANYVVSSSSSKRKEPSLPRPRQGSQKRVISSQGDMNVIDFDEEVQETEESKQ
jgi:hypothetical protein